MKKLVLAVSAAVLATGALVANADDAVVAKYNKSCAVCHASGAANAPKTGDAAAWAPRLEKGTDVLVASINNGLNAMPPKGLCMDCSDDDYKALIEYMSKGQ